MAAAKSIGFIGAGHVGSALAKLGVDNGHHVVLSNSRGPETLHGLVRKLGEHAASSTVDVATEQDIVVVSVPLKAYKCVPPDQVIDKIVIDTNNYYPDRDGKFPELDNDSTTSAELLQQHIPQAKVVKAFNVIAYFQLPDGLKRGAKNRRALPIAGNDFAAKQVVAALIDEFGFDVVDLGPLSMGRYFQTIPYGKIAVGMLGNWVSKKLLRTIPVYGVRHNYKDLRKALINNGWQPPQGPVADIFSRRDDDEKEEKKKDQMNVAETKEVKEKNEEKKEEKREVNPLEVENS